ncbi:hypothetical protein ACFX1S_027481 [Malus domestica]
MADGDKFINVLSLDSQDNATNILSNLYDAAGKCDSAVEMKRKIRVMKSKKDPGLNGTKSEQEVAEPLHCIHGGVVTSQTDEFDEPI